MTSLGTLSERLIYSIIESLRCGPQTGRPLVLSRAVNSPSMWDWMRGFNGNTPHKIAPVQPSAENTLHITLTSWWLRWRLKSPASRLFTQPFIQTQIKENIKAPCHWPLCGEFTETGEFPAQRASNAENVFIWWRHHDDLHYLEEIGVLGAFFNPMRSVGFGFNGSRIHDNATTTTCVWRSRFDAFNFKHFLCSYPRLKNTPFSRFGRKKTLLFQPKTPFSSNCVFFVI